MKELFSSPQARLWPILAIAAIIVCCKKEEQEQTKEQPFNVSGVVLPEVIEAPAGGTVELQVLGGHGPAKTDKVELQGDERFTMDITEASEKKFSFALPEDIYSGDFIFNILRGSQTKKVGRCRVSVINNTIVEPEGSTVYGQITAKGRGIPGVAVSDGVEVVVTDDKGVYHLNSAKKHGYVFISTPSGYETLSEGILPTFHRQLNAEPTTAERVDFDLVPVKGQENSTMLIMGDIHLANRTNDRAQFGNFLNDVNAFVTAAGSRKVYGLTLGDMTWDLYTLVNNYSYTDYVTDMNNIKGLQIYHTIGNHDHSMYYTGDFDTVKEYKQVIGPTYYSFNIGKVHYVVLDDVECKNSVATVDTKNNPCYKRDYDGNVVNEQITWLEKDLALVDAATPLVVSMHIQFHYENGTYRFISAARATKLEDILKKFQKVWLFTGHTHTIYHVQDDADPIHEFNGGAVCGTWWWSGYETPGVHIGQDGSPGGYTVMTVDGTNIKWQYKATDSPVDYQFRSYDRNEIQITADRYVPNGNKDGFNPGFWSTEDKSNEIYVNVWNYDPQWKVEMSENGTTLTVTKVKCLDPLHLISYTAKRLNANAEAGFATTTNNHTFKAVASSATSTIDIKVTDRFGNVYTEKMTRPKPFSVDTYKK